MKIRRYRLFSSLFLLIVSAISLYYCRAQDYSFLKRASGGIQCWECSIDIPNSPCGGVSDGQTNCEYDEIQQKCDPAECWIWCNSGNPNWYCHETTPGDSTWCATPEVLCNWYSAWTCREDEVGSGDCWCYDVRLIRIACSREGCILTPP